MLRTGNLRTASTVRYRVPGWAKPTVPTRDLNAPENRLEIRPEDARLGENAGATTVTVLRLGENTTPLRVRWETRDDTARAGVDYVAASGEVVHPFGPPPHVGGYTVCEPLP